MIKADNATEDVKSVNRLKTSGDGYMIVIENADGYVADDYLVLSKGKEVSVPSSPIITKSSKPKPKK